MPTPKTKTQNASLWVGALLLSLVVAAVASIMKQPMTEDINWRIVFNDIGTVFISLSPVLAAGLNLPRLGGEERAALANELGHKKAEKVLKDAVQSNGQARPQVDLDELAKKIIEQNKREQQRIRQQNPPGFYGENPIPVNRRSSRGDT